MKFIFLNLVFLLALSPLTITYADNTPNKPVNDAESLTSLLDRIKNFEQTENDKFKERLIHFSQKKKKQDKILKQAKHDLIAAQKSSEKLTSLFSKNEKNISELKAQLKEQSGTLGELFGVVKQVSGDARAKFESSFITPQYPDRIAVIDTLAKGKVLPDVKQLSGLWFELQREMTASAQVIKYSAPVINLSGEEVEKTITRIGNFSAFIDDQYLVTQISQPGFVEISRQPGGPHGKFLTNFNANPTSFSPISIDPSQGVILTLLTKSPSVQERIDQGGYVGYVILMIGAIGLLIALERLIHLSIVNRRIKKQLKSDTADKNNPLGRVLDVFQNHHDLNVETLELKLDEEILRNMPPLERGITTIKVLAAVAPLLGLLGTVIGMIQTFQAITLFGTGDPKLMAGGISEALVTTMLGLIVAVPLILSHSMVSTRSRRLMKIMEEQSTGYVARHALSLDKAA